jgi:D-tyrosyl-tRNA(Tyr) deacylase
MRLLIQRVQSAQVLIENQLYSSIQYGMLVFLALHKEDTEKTVKSLVTKLLHLRIFKDQAEKMNCSLQEIKGQLLVVSQFTLYGNCMNGRRPDFLEALAPAQAEPLYNLFIECLLLEGANVQTGKFGADMQVALINDGPMTFLIESKSLSSKQKTLFSNSLSAVK